MAAPERFDLEGLAGIPDPAGHVVGRQPPEPMMPAEPSLTRAQRRTRGMFVLASSIGWVLLFVAFMGPRPDLFSPWVMLPLLLWIGASAGALVLALVPRKRGIPVGVRAIQVIVAALPLLFGICALAWSAGTPDGFSLRGAGICLQYTSLMASGPLVLACLMFRRSFTAAAAWRGAAIGAVCGLAGSIGIHSHCPTGGTLHALIGHGLPIVAGALVGAVLGAIRGRI